MVRGQSFPRLLYGEFDLAAANHREVGMFESPFAQIAIYFNGK